MDERTLEESIETYSSQLYQVEQAILAAGETPDLVALRTDLQDFIKLTKESILSLKKSVLLNELDYCGAKKHTEHESYSGKKAVGNNISFPSLSGSNTCGEDDAPIDDEYAAFQAMLGDDIFNTGKENQQSQLETKEENLQTSSSYSNGDQQSTSAGINFLNDVYKDIIGTKCQAPYTPDWGTMHYGNALISAIEMQSDTEVPKVRVMFCNPTHMAMLPCKYLLEGNCRFTDTECRYSHGHIVDFEDLQEYQEPDYSLLKMESHCLARYDDDLWYKAMVVDHPSDTVTVTFDSYKDDPVTLPLEDVLPLGDANAWLSSDSDEDDRDDVTEIKAINRQESDDDEDDFPVYLWKPKSHGLGDLGQWEAHTKGIGSRLLTKMGYIPGQGLGRDGEGRVEPVPIQLLPQGKSLDRIMALKEIAGRRDMFDVTKRQEMLTKRNNEKLAKSYNEEKKPNMFDFINQKLGGKKGNLCDLVHHHSNHKNKVDRGQSAGSSHRTITEHDLKQKSDKSINIQLLKTSEEMKTVEKELAKLKQSLFRNENRDRTMTTQVKHKIASLQSYLEKLKSSEAAIQNHRQQRSDHKKLTMF